MRFRTAIRRFFPLLVFRLPLAAVVSSARCVVVSCKGGLGGGGGVEVRIVTRQGRWEPCWERRGLLVGGFFGGGGGRGAAPRAFSTRRGFPPP